MAWRIRWTELAWGGAEAAAEYIARDSPRYAAALIREARTAARSLREFPIFVQSYRLIYRVRDDEVQIINFIHGARSIDGNILVR
ncbi:MAG: type II toxin-antitoxin system RelE/ParE family toxin [Thermoanaerobaculia bacterium]